MNKKIIIILSVLILGIILFIFINILKKGYKKELNNLEKQVLVISSYSNYAWGIQIKEKVIFNDGTIYTWNFDGNNDDLNNYDKSNEKEFILKNGIKSSIKVSSKDLDKLNEYIKKVDNTTEYKCMGADQGTNSIFVIKNNEKILINSSGDCIKKINEYESLINLIEKYLKQI